jgi:hypothetical protein
MHASVSHAACLIVLWTPPGKKILQLQIPVGWALLFVPNTSEPNTAMFRCLTVGCRQRLGYLSGPLEWIAARRRPPITLGMSLFDRLFRARYYTAQRRCYTTIRIGPHWRSLNLLSERKFALGSCSTVNCHANCTLNSGVEADHILELQLIIGLQAPTGLTIRTLFQMSLMTV